MSEENQEAVEEQVAEQPIKQGADNPLFKTLFDVAEEAAPVQEEPEEDLGRPISIADAVDEIDLSKQPQEDLGEEEVEPVTEPEKTEPKKKKLRKVVDPEVPEDVLKQPTFNLKEEPKEDPEEIEFVNSLIPEERSLYEKVKYAEKKLDGHKGKSTQFKSYLKKSKAYLDKRIDEDVHFDPSTDEEYASFIKKNRPSFTRLDEEKVNREMIIDEAESRASKAHQKEIQELKNKINHFESAPKLNEAKANFRRVAQQRVIPEEYRQKLAEGGDEAIKKLSDENPFEFQILEGMTQKMLTHADALTDIFLDPATQLDVENNQVHKDLNDWLEMEQSNFVKSGQTEQDGKVFMRRERYFQTPENKRSQYYTWSDNDLMKLLVLRYQDMITNGISNHRKQMEAAGYKRGVNKQEQAPQPKAKPPIVNATPRQGTQVDSKPKPIQTNALFNTLGL
jgi:hypothetical protein